MERDAVPVLQKVLIPRGFCSQAGRQLHGRCRGVPGGTRAAHAGSHLRIELIHVISRPQQHLWTPGPLSRCLGSPSGRSDDPDTAYKTQSDPVLLALGSQM